MAISKESAERSVKSLQELCLDAAFHQMIQPNFEKSSFNSLEPRLKDLLFSKFRDEAASAWPFMQGVLQNFPEADLRLHHRFQTLSEQNGTSHWQYGLDEGGAGPGSVDSRDEDDECYFEDWKYGPQPSRDVHQSDGPRGFCDMSRRISPHLLFYRLHLIFGSVPDQLEVHPDLGGRWVVNLVYKDGSALCFGDSIGDVQAYFYGTEVAREKAEKMVECFLSTPFIGHKWC